MVSVTFVLVAFFIYKWALKRWRARLFKGSRIGRFRVIRFEREGILLSDGESDLYCLQDRLFPWSLK